MSLETLAERVRAALQAGDLESYGDVLDGDVHWGPPDEPGVGCNNRDDVLARYKAASDRGMRATVDEVVVGKDALLVGMTVRGAPAAGQGGGSAPRWQVLSVEAGRITDIAGYDDRGQAAARAGIG